jgi:hypothetical protein
VGIPIKSCHIFGEQAVKFEKEFLNRDTNQLLDQKIKHPGNNL